MPPFYLVRVTTDDHDFVKEKLLKNKKTICCSEVGGETEKPHVHFILFESKSTVWRRLQQAGYTGNGSFAFTEGDDGEHDVQNTINYICKGESLEIPPIILVNSMGLTSEQIRQHQVDYWTHVKQKDSSGDKGARAKVPAGSRKNNDTPLLRRVLFCKEHGITSSSAGWEIAGELIQYYQENHGCEPNDFQIKCYAKSIQRHLVYENAKESGRMDKWERYKRLRAQQIIGNEWIHIDS